MKILFDGMFGIGNMVMFTPALKALRKAYPDAEITGLFIRNGSSEVLSDSEYQNRELFMEKNEGIISVVKKLRPYHFDISLTNNVLNGGRNTIINFLAGCETRVAHLTANNKKFAFLISKKVLVKPKNHDIENNLNLVRALGIKAVRTRVYFHLTKEAKAIAKEYFKNLGKTVVGFHPSCNPNMSWKRWEPKKFAALADALITENDADIIIFGGPGEKKMNEEIKALTRNNDRVRVETDNTLKQSAALIQKCSLMVSNDSGLMHVADGVDTPIVAIFGATPEYRNGPTASKHIIVKKDLPCRPCRTHSIQKFECVNKNYLECLKSISVDEVKNAAQELLK